MLVYNGIPAHRTLVARGISGRNHLCASSPCGGIGIRAGFKYRFLRVRLSPGAREMVDEKAAVVSFLRLAVEDVVGRV